ncbi:hypothetical protein [Nocardiopsis ganjiahuensis]|uniref:hypothetical protein n=1 Tax=Nocardiopsis ganjiahuensis TaxID=239984 RepID=UPI00036702F3|nr:hypothetical protein [Nocardiopsis ganjiahuensis]
MFTIGSILCLALFWVLRKKVHWLISGFFAVIGGTFFAMSFLGGWATDLVLWVVGFLLSLIPDAVSSGTAIAAICAFLLVVAGADVWRDKRLDEHGQWAAICLPVLLLAAGGAIGGVGGDVVYNVAGAGTNIFGPLLGW